MSTDDGNFLKKKVINVTRGSVAVRGTDDDNIHWNIN